MDLPTDLRARHGAIFMASGLTRFALWAPDAQAVSVVTSDGRSWPMPAQQGGWFVLEVVCAAGTLYKYRVDAHLEVPDPASHAQAEDIYGYSVVLDQNVFRWQHQAWQGRPWHEAIFYELHVGLVGGYAAVEAMLPRLADLGVTAIELMPLAQFPGIHNWGYDGVFPYAPQASYGSPHELKSLIDTAHGLDLAVVLDVVYNHFGPDGNNLNAYAREFFRSDKETPWGDAIDYRRREVRDFFIDSALMWLQDYRFDGLRLDAVHAIEDPTFLEEFSQRVRQQCGEARQVWLILENELNEAHRLEQGFDAQWNDDGHNTLHVLLTGETDAYYADFAQATTQKLARMLSEGFVYQGEATSDGQPRGECSVHLPPSAFVLFLQNHDQIGNRAFGERLVHLAPTPALRAATVLLLLSPMIPLIFMGDECGADQPFLFFTDFRDELAQQVCEGRRGEFENFAAFADKETRERIPDPNATSSFENSIPALDAPSKQKDQDLNPADWLALYRELLQLRQREILPRLPGAKAIETLVLGDKAVSARWRMGDGSVLRIDLNLSDRIVYQFENPVGRTLYELPARNEEDSLRLSLDRYAVLVTLQPSGADA
ncbi:malto-oligosyltrehalose trehalohydrolase [Pseudomonas sp. TWP3-2]|uniref:malto-oligosyltrehalose trehalohydrolase n=1 Tax=Pseudomonas sp. TWP3-2 TaxID=2804574 RepID=UPI003CF8A1F7